MEMTEDDNKRNRRIAKNTLMLYLRMFITMGISLYTSRIILAYLGVEDFGIYNVVAGIVVLFSFLNSAMTHTSQRYLSVAIAKNDDNLIQKTFSTSIVSHLFISAILLILAETIGLWFVNTQLSIPDGRMSAANIVYQFAVAITLIEINKIPYFSSIVANEKMTFFAYLAIVESAMKLAVALSLTLFSCDLLILYGALLLATAIIVIAAFIIYCNKNFRNCKFIPTSSKPMLKEFLSFSGWNLIGSSAYLGYTQGVNIILNIFRGVALNATIGITNQIRSATYSFVYYFQTASNPQIIKAYTNNEHDRFTTLVCNISKYSFFMMLAIAIPIVMNMDYILNLWLVNPPAYCSIFCSMIVIICLFDSLEGPLWVAVQASGSIRNYQITTGIILLLNIPASFFALKYEAEPYSVMYIQLAFVIIAWITRIYFAKKCSNLKNGTYFKKVIIPIMAISIISIPTCHFSVMNLNGMTKVVVSTGICLTIMALTIYTIGISKGERAALKKYIKEKISK